MNKLKLLLKICICGVVFSGCSFFDDLFVQPFSDEIKYTKNSPNDACIPDDMMKRLAKKSYYEGYYQNKMFRYDWQKEFVNVTNDYGKIFSDDRYKGTGMFKCYDLVTQSYNEAIKNATKLPTNIKEEQIFEKEWLVCDNMPKWLETKLFDYINQNKGNDLAYIDASNFRVSWGRQLTGDDKYVWGELLTNDRGRMANCVAKKAAIKAIENDLIDLGDGKKGKCADLSYDDAPKCLAYFKAVYDKTYNAKKKELDAEEDALEIKRVRLKHEKQNRQ
ncbi:hypothetical protein ACWIUD_08205 [Helicobacter sp. 23-1044]